MVKIGIVGTGATVSIAHFHAEGYKKDPRAKIAAVYDINREAAEKWVSDHGLDAAVCGSYEELLDRCDAVDLCTPNFLHYPQAKAALEAGRHIFVEKPMAVTLEDCEALSAQAGGSALCGMVGMVYRCANSIRMTQKIVREQIGPVFTLTAWAGGKRLANPQNPVEWRMLRSRSGSGALGDFGSHLVDLASYVAGQSYTRVACQTGTFIPERPGQDGTPQRVENDDAAMFVANGTNGMGSFTVSRVGLDDIMLLIAGAGGMVQVSLRTPEMVTYWEKDPAGGYSGSVRQIDLEPQKPFDGWFDKEMSVFLDGIEGDRSDLCDIRQGLYMERVLFAAERAQETGMTQEVGG